MSPPVRLVEKNVIHKSTSFFSEASWFRKEIAGALHRKRGASTLGKENSDHWSFEKLDFWEFQKTQKNWSVRYDFEFVDDSDLLRHVFCLKRQQGIMYI